MSSEPDWVKKSRMHRKIHTVIEWICVSGFVFGSLFKLVVWIKGVAK